MSWRDGYTDHLFANGERSPPPPPTSAFFKRPSRVAVTKKRHASCHRHVCSKRWLYRSCCLQLWGLRVPAPPPPPQPPPFFVCLTTVHHVRSFRDFSWFFIMALNCLMLLADLSHTFSSYALHSSMVLMASRIFHTYFHQSSSFSCLFIIFHRSSDFLTFHAVPSCFIMHHHSHRIGIVFSMFHFITFHSLRHTSSCAIKTVHHIVHQTSYSHQTSYLSHFP